MDNITLQFVPLFGSGALVAIPSTWESSGAFALSAAAGVRFMGAPVSFTELPFSLPGAAAATMQTIWLDSTHRRLSHTAPPQRGIVLPQYTAHHVWAKQDGGAFELAKITLTDSAEPVLCGDPGTTVHVRTLREPPPFLVLTVVWGTGRVF